jgi:hypothetical protein
MRKPGHCGKGAEKEREDFVNMGAKKNFRLNPEV